MKIRNKYLTLKATTIVLGAVSIPWSMFTGYSFGQGNYSTGIASLVGQTAVALVDGYIWFWVLENMKDKGKDKAVKESVEARPGLRAVCPFLADKKAMMADSLEDIEDMAQIESLSR